MGRIKLREEDEPAPKEMNIETGPRNCVHEKYHEQVVAELRTQLAKSLEREEELESMLDVERMRDYCQSQWQPISGLPEKGEPGDMVALFDDEYGYCGGALWLDIRGQDGPGWYDSKFCSELCPIIRNDYTHFYKLPPVKKEEVQ